MRIQVMWDDDDKTIIRFQVEPHWTWDEFVAAQQVAYELADTVRHKVGIIIPEAATLPPEAVSGRKDFTFITNRHSNVDIFVLVVRGLLIRGMISLMMKLYTPAASLVVVVATMDEARNPIKGRLEAAS